MPSPAKRAVSKRRQADAAAESEVLQRSPAASAPRAQQKPEPQHPKSAKAHYMWDNQAVIRERNGLNASEVDKMMKAAWAEWEKMDPAAQEPYVKKAEKDKA